jgi:TolB-like protein/Tfp pilus assembly protein PilF
LNGFLSELKRRNVIRMAGLYLVGAWLLTQVAATLLPVFEAPGWVMKTIVGILAVGFIPALIFAWVFELTPEGLKRDSEIPEAQSIAPLTAQRMNRLIVALLVLAVVYFGFDKFVLAPKREAASVAIALKAEKTKADSVKNVIADKSIAVLPFVNMSTDPEQEFFSDGLSEEILNLLAQMGDLKVIGRTSSFAFKGKNEDMRSIGKTLGVAYLLEGSVRKAGNDLRITAQLIKAEDGSHLWSQSYDRKLENVFAIQSEIAGSIAEAMKIKLLASQQGSAATQATTSLPAYELFLKARGLIHGRTRSGMESARELLDQALKLDPNYAQALAAQAQTLYFLNNSGSGYGDIPPEQAATMAQPLLDRALALDPKLAEAHAVQSLIFNQKRDFPRAEAALASALALNPNLPDALHWQAQQLGASGYLREQLAVRQRLDAIDPLNVANLLSLSGALRDSGRPNEAQAVTARLLRAFPDNPQSFGAKAGELFGVGRLAEAQVPLARMLALGSNWAPGVNARLYYTLGDFNRVLSLQDAQGWRLAALIALNRNNEAVAAARARFAAGPEDRGAAQDLLTTLSWTGRFDEVLALYRERWVNHDGVAAYFSPVRSGTFEAIAIAQRAKGQQSELAETMALWRKRLDFQREQGYANGGFLMDEASYFAVAGERVAALKALTQAIDLGVRNPLLGRNPAFAGMKDDPSFKAQNVRMIKLINIERAKLKMAPLT